MTIGMDAVVFLPDMPRSLAEVPRIAGSDAVEVERRSRVALNMSFRRRSRSLSSRVGRTSAAQVEQTN